MNPASGDSIQQPVDPPVYMKLAQDRIDWRASGILHDFNNQLAIILSHCSIALMKMPADSNARANLDRSIRATKRAADLSNQLQVGITMQEDEMIAVNLNQFAQESLDALEPKLITNATIEARFAPDLPAIVSSPILIYQMIVNLLLNALEALPDDKGHISIVTESMSLSDTNKQGYSKGIPAGEYAVVQVSDTGIGMDQIVLDQIFTPFFSTKPMRTGLGLTMTMHIMQLHRGIIHVQSTPNQGTVFQLFFPVK